MFDIYLMVYWYDVVCMEFGVIFNLYIVKMLEKEKEEIVL